MLLCVTDEGLRKRSGVEEAAGCSDDRFVDQSAEQPAASSTPDRFLSPSSVTQSNIRAARHYLSPRAFALITYTHHLADLGFLWEAAWMARRRAYRE